MASYSLISFDIYGLCLLLQFKQTKKEIIQLIIKSHILIKALGDFILGDHEMIEVRSFKDILVKTYRTLTQLLLGKFRHLKLDDKN
ncbi:hypothetical protein [Desulfonispora thiosulfatigenes]|uniref:hypothetical protein n=1 Tax=Desulfonispora thiosulfatigenes TaxID=83661 RepID=UPI0009FC5840|nr:hypothetical protein [Desulfonispora thiosulfatigenes]